MVFSVQVFSRSTVLFAILVAVTSIGVESIDCVISFICYYFTMGLILLPLSDCVLIRLNVC